MYAGRRVSDVTELDATAQAELVASGDASPAELVDAAIARVERTNGALNAVIHERFDRARRDALDPPAGPFRGVPIVIKDLDGPLAGDNGSVLFAEVYSAKVDADKKPITGSDGFYAPDQLLFYTAMARDAGWGKDIPDMLRNEDWNYAVFTNAKQLRAGVNQAECLACHKPLDKTSYTFTLEQITAAAKAK